jgi:hypothetical protein
MIAPGPGRRYVLISPCRNEAAVYWSRIWALYVLIRWCHRHGIYR